MTVIALAISNRLVLEIAFASLVADRTIKRVIDEEEFHHALPRLLDHWTVRADFLSISRRECAAGLRFGWPRLHFNERSEERRGGKAGGSTCRSGGSPGP